jgi:hypothetical protein
LNKKNKVFLIHFQSLELYPPAMNLIDYLGTKLQGGLFVVTTKKKFGNFLSAYVNNSSSVRIIRAGFSKKHSFYRLLNYGSFYLRCFLLLIRNRPEAIFYIETMSSWPALFYKKYFNRKVKLLVHYHEYTTPDEYDHSMKLAKWSHQFESLMYDQFTWISQTNSVRLQLFKDDHHLNDLPESVFHIMPNYPPQKWLAQNKDYSLKAKKTHLVYVGALGYENMYLQELMDWLGEHKTEFTLDIYSHNMDKTAAQLLANNQNSNITYHGGCDYHSLPQILRNFDVGLVIYKPFSQNTIHAVSNKVFEYLACGLDVWFSEAMTHSLTVVRTQVYPKILPVDFASLGTFDYEKALNRRGLIYSPSEYFSENIYKEVYKVLS